MEQIQSAMEAHLDQMADLVHQFSADFRSGLGPALDNFIGFFHAINWKVTLLLSSFFECKTQFLIYFGFSGTMVDVFSWIPLSVFGNRHSLKEES